MSRTVEDLINEWNTKTTESVKNLKDLGIVLNQNEEKIVENYKIVR